MKFTNAQKAELISMNLLETAEIFLFINGVIQGVDKANDDDDKVSVPEGIFLGLSLSGEAIDAIKGLKNIPSELVDLTPGEVEALAAIAFPSLSDYPLHQRHLINAYIGVVVNLVNVYRIHKDPPKPTIVP